MIKIIQTNDKLLPRRQSEWRNSQSTVTSAMPNIGQAASNVNDSEIDMIANQLNGQSEDKIKQPCNKSIKITDVKQFEINKYINNFVKQNGSIIDDNSNAKNEKSIKILLG
jgi:hypothetical protein